MNMSYVRFENTFGDLQDCFENLDAEDLSGSEKDYRQRLIELCVQISEWAEEQEDEDF